MDQHRISYYCHHHHHQQFPFQTQSNCHKHGHLPYQHFHHHFQHHFQQHHFYLYHYFYHHHFHNNHINYVLEKRLVTQYLEHLRELEKKKKKREDSRKRANLEEKRKTLQGMKYKETESCSIGHVYINEKFEAVKRGAKARKSRYRIT
jgi:hypothetical protein